MTTNDPDPANSIRIKIWQIIRIYASKTLQKKVYSKSKNLTEQGGEKPLVWHKWMKRLVYSYPTRAMCALSQKLSEAPHKNRACQD